LETLKVLFNNDKTYLCICSFGNKIISVIIGSKTHL